MISQKQLLGLPNKVFRFFTISFGQKPMTQQFETNVESFTLRSRLHLSVNDERALTVYSTGCDLTITRKKPDAFGGQAVSSKGLMRQRLITQSSGGKGTGS